MRLGQGKSKGANFRLEDESVAMLNMTMKISVLITKLA